MINISKIKNRLLSNYQDNIQTKTIRSLLAKTYWNLKRKRGGLGGRKVRPPKSKYFLWKVFNT